MRLLPTAAPIMPKRRTIDPQETSASSASSASSPSSSLCAAEEPASILNRFGGDAVTDKWLNIASYEDVDLNIRRDQMGYAQSRDGQRRVGGISSVELKTDWMGEVLEIVMTINRGLEGELAIKLSPEQMEVFTPILIFEARFAIHRHSAGKRLDRDGIADYSLVRCPDCACGPIGPEVLAAQAVLMIEAASTNEEIDRINDEHVRQLENRLFPATLAVISRAIVERRAFWRGRKSSDGDRGA